MIINSIIYIIAFIAIVLVAYFLICGVAKVTENPDKLGEGSSVGGFLGCLIIIGAILLIIYIFYALGGENPPYDSPFRR